MRLLILLSLLLALAACDTGTDGTNNAAGSNTIIQWDRSPETVVFRAEVTGGQSDGTFLARNEIPLCTIYGDNRVIWLNELDDFDVQVLWDKVTDQQIQDFVSLLTISRRVFTYDAGADLQLPSDIQPVVEVLYVNVNDREHTADSFSSEPWPFDYFSGIVDFCKQVSRAPVIYEPEGAWLTVQPADYDSSRPMQVWNSEAAGLNFGERAASNESTWLTGPNLKILWNTIRSSSPNVLFTDMDGNAFEVVLEVPGVNPSSPPAP